MSRKHIINPIKLIDSGDMSGNIAGTVEIGLKQVDNVGIIAQWSGTAPVGKIELSVKVGGSSWAVLDFGNDIAVSGNSGSLNVDLTGTPYTDIKADYVRTGGLGTLSVWLSAKSIGA